MVPVRQLTFGVLRDEFVALTSRNRTILLAGAGALIVFDLIATQFINERTANSLGNIVGAIAVFLLIREMLRQEGLIEHEGGFGGYFIASLLSGLGVIVGLILLIVPGLYLLARWSIAPTLTIARKQSGVEAMRESWSLTADSAWTLVGVYLVCGLGLVILVFLAGAFGAAIAAAPDASEPLLSTLLVSVLANLFLVASATLSVALYRLLAAGSQGLQQVFE